MRHKLTVLTVLVFWFATSNAILFPTLALAQCCIQPLSETTQAVGIANTTMSKFKQVVSDSQGSNFDGMVVREQPGAQGADTCWFNGSLYDPVDTITGGLWQIADPLVNNANGQHNTWAHDYVGVTPDVVDYYRVQAPNHGRAIPCGFTVWQTMQILCDTTWVTYTAPYNKLTVQIEQHTVINCRFDMSDTACATISY